MTVFGQIQCQSVSEEARDDYSSKAPILTAPYDPNLEIRVSRPSSPQIRQNVNSVALIQNSHCDMMQEGSAKGNMLKALQETLPIESNLDSQSFAHANLVGEDSPAEINQVGQSPIGIN